MYLYIKEGAQLGNISNVRHDSYLGNSGANFADEDPVLHQLPEGGPRFYQ